MAALLELVPLLVALACLLIAAILAVVVTAFIKFVASIVGKIPYLGDILVSHLDGIQQSIWHALGVAFRGADSALGWMLHTDARLLDWTWRELKSHAAAIAAIASPVSAALTLAHGIRSLVHGLTQHFQWITKAVKTLEREYHGIEHRVKVLEHDIARGIGHDVLPRVRSLERELGHLEHRVIPAVEDAEAALANDVTALGEYIRANFLSSATDAVTAAVVVALGALGLGGLRCSNFRNLLNKFGCGLGSILNDLIGLALSVLALESVCEFLPLLEKAFGAVVGPMVHLLNEVPLGACETPPESWAKLSVAAGPQPPQQSLGSLPTG